MEEKGIREISEEETIKMLTMALEESNNRNKELYNQLKEMTERVANMQTQLNTMKGQLLGIQDNVKKSTLL